MSKKTLIILISIILIIGIVVGLIFIINSEEPSTNIEHIKPTVNENGEVEAPSKVYSNEEAVSQNKAEELFRFIPKIYTEQIAPFTSTFMLDAVMSKIIDVYEEQDFSIENIDRVTHDIFGENANIVKEEVSEPDVVKSLYYYSKDSNSYAVIPVGYEGIYKYQILKNATETEDAYYVYTYVLIGGYSYDENDISIDEFGDVNYENAKVQVVVGDKSGSDLVHTFTNFSEIYDEDVWISNYKNKMPVFRYTLKKDGRNYYITEVEQVNY